CLTRKLPLRAVGWTIGLIGISCDLGGLEKKDLVYPRLRCVVDELHGRIAEPVRIAGLARLADMSVSQLERQFRRVFQLTPRAFLTKLRIDHAAVFLATKQSVAHIVQACGYADHSVFIW